MSFGPAAATAFRLLSPEPRSGLGTSRQARPQAGVPVAVGLGVSVVVRVAPKEMPAGAAGRNWWAFPAGTLPRAGKAARANTPVARAIATDSSRTIWRGCVVRESRI